MTVSLPPVIVDNGSSTTRAGFASEELPSLVFGTNYIKSDNGEKFFGTEALENRPEAEIMTIMDDGVIYDTDAASKNWTHVYQNLDNGNGADPREHALMATEHAWTQGRTRAQLAQVAFEELQVPLFSLVKTPLAQLYHMGRSSGIVVDIGSAVTTVTPILDGILQSKSSFHSHYAGDFLDLHCLRSIEKKLGYNPTHLDYTRLLPARLRGFSAPTSSYLSYHVAQHALLPFKQTMLSVTEAPPGVPNSANYYPSAQRTRPPAYQLPDGIHVHYADHEGSTLCEPLFVPHAYPLPGLVLPEPTYNQASSHGVSNLVLYALKSLESAFLASAGNDSQNANVNARFNEVLRQLLSNTLITGGGALIPGLADRVCGDLSRTAPQILPGYVITGSYKLYISPLRNHNTGSINDTFDKKFGSWLGAANLASMLKDGTADEAGSVGIALDNWFVSKADYEELGEDLIVEKFK